MPVNEFERSGRMTMRTTDGTPIFRWQDREERRFVNLYYRGGHFRVAWGASDPPKTDNFVEEGHHTTRVAEEAVELMLQNIGNVAAEANEVERVEPRLRDALAGSQHLG